MTRTIKISGPDTIKLLKLLNCNSSFPNVKAELEQVLVSYAHSHLRDHGIYSGATMYVLSVALTAEYKGGVECAECQQYREVLYGD